MELMINHRWPLDTYPILKGTGCLHEGIGFEGRYMLDLKLCV